MYKTIISLIIASIMILCAMTGSIFAKESEEVYFDVYGMDEAGIYRKYSGMFKGQDISLNIDGLYMEKISLLRDFDFNSLDIRINYKSEEEYDNMDICRDLLFPDCVNAVNVTVEGEAFLKDSTAMENLIMCLYVCSPGATLNNTPVIELTEEIYKNDSYGMAGLMETNAKLHYVFDLAQNGQLEIADGEPSFYGKMIFHIFDDVELSSPECLEAGEDFFSVPASYLAENFDEADVVVYVFPVQNILGRYANGGEAVTTFTRVCVVDLNTMEMYQPYTAVTNDPPEVLDIDAENGRYSSEGAVGAYEPKKAVNDIITSGNYQPEKTTGKTDKAEQSSEKNLQEEFMILPWLSYEAKEAQQETETQTTTEAAKTSGVEMASSNAATEEKESSGTAKNSQTEQDEKETLLPATVEKEDDSKDQEKDQAAENGSNAELYSWMTDKMLDIIFEELSDDNLKKTYDTLKVSKDAAYGTRGTMVQGIQYMLTEFGKDVAIDGSMGNGTIAALNEVQAAFGLEETSKMSSSIFAKLMPCLLMYKDPGTAEKLFSEYYTETEDTSESMYYKACIMCLEGSSYQAKKLFESCNFADSELRSQTCILDMPATGQIYTNSSYKGTDTSLSVSVNSYDEASASCIKIYTEDDELAAVLLIRGSGEASASLTEGSYKIFSGSGYRWYGINDMFGSDGSYEYLSFNDGDDVLDLRKGFDYSITFNVIEHNETASYVGTNEIDWEDMIPAED